MNRTRLRVLVALCAFVSIAASAARAQFGSANEALPRDDVKVRYAPIETSPARPLALSQDGQRLYAIHQPGARLLIYHPASLHKLMEIPVGPGLVCVAPREDTSEVWAVDTIANAVTVVDWRTGEILRSIRVGAQPQDLVFSQDYDRAYVSCAGDARVDVISTASATVVASIGIPAARPHGLAWLKGRCYVAPLLSGNNTSVRGTSPDLGAFDASEVRALADFPALPQLPDRDLLVIEAQPDAAQDALILGETRTGLGTILFNLRARPGTSQLWIPNTDALNAVHKGAANFVKGQVVRNRVTIVDVQTGAPLIVDLDSLAPNVASRCAQPTGVCFDPVRPFAYVCGYGTDRIAVLDLSGPAIAWAGHIEVLPLSASPPTAGPRDAVVDAAGRYLFVLNKIDNSLSRVDLNQLPSGPGFVMTAPPPLSLGFDPTPLKIRRGRSHANNARLSASQTSSCDSCHVDAQTDGLAWDLSDYKDPEGTPNALLQFGLDLKGPLTTQSLLALAETAPYHWRGEKRGLLDFNAAFEGLLERQVNGVPTPFPPDQFAYIIFYMQGLQYPPNPRQAPDRALTPAQRLGAKLFIEKKVLDELTCASCHQLPLGTTGEVVEAREGSLAPATDVPQLRGLADKLSAPLWIGDAFGRRIELGTGLGHGGVFADLEGLLLQERLDEPGTLKFDLTPTEAGQIADFLEAWDTGLAPATGFQVTARGADAAEVEASELAYLTRQASRGNCDVIFRRALQLPAGGIRYESGLFDPASGRFLPARVTDAPIDPHALIAEAETANVPVTFLGLPLWLGRPMAIDRDLDQLLDGDELAAGTLPEVWDSDHDGYPDGYEVALGLDPLTPNSTTPDLTAPSVVGAPRLIYVTQSAIKFELGTDEPTWVQISLNDGPIVQRLPIGNHFDERFSVVLSALTAGTAYVVHLELADPSNNTSDFDLDFTTAPLGMGEPVHVENIKLTTTSGPQHLLAANVQLLRGAAPAADDYVVKALVFHLAAAGKLTLIQPAATAKTVGGVGLARFGIPLPPLQPGFAFLVVTGVQAPVDQPPYVRALSVQTAASIHL
jgi:DNA-binding beta-propeller fold protein YncE